MKTTFVLCCFAAVLPYLEAQDQEAPPRAAASKAVDAAVKQRMLATLPNPLPRNGKSDEAPSFYLSANLYEYMDGGADIYQLYEVETLLHTDLHTNAGDLTIDIFDMGNTEGAFGMFSAESSPSYDYFPLGIAAYRNQGIVNFAQDRYYVKLAAFGDNAAPLLDEYARAISARIGGSSRMPALVRSFPEKGRTPHSEQFIRKDPMGHPFLAPVYQAAYGESKLMISVGKDAADAAARLRDLAAHFSKTGKWEDSGGGVMRGTNSFEGSLVARVKGRYLVILLNPESNGPQLLAEALGRVE